jgi:hypothetical protein
MSLHNTRRLSATNARLPGGHSVRRRLLGGLLFIALVSISAMASPGGALAASDRAAEGLPALVAGPQTDYDLGQGIHMTTSVRVSRDVGRIDGHTRTWTTWWGVGGHGAVGVYLLDANGNVIGAGDAHRYGVDAKSIFWGRSDRTDDWTDAVPTEITSRTEAVVISHTSTQVDNFQNILDEAKKKGCAIFQLLGKECPFK